MNKLPPGAARLLQQARQSDQAHRVDLDATLRDLHAVLPFADLGPLSAPEPGAGVDAGGGPGTAPPSAPPPVSVDALTAGTLLGAKAVKVFLATVVLGGAVGGASLLGGPARRADRRPHEVPALVAPAAPALPASSSAVDSSASTLASEPPTNHGDRTISKASAPRTTTKAGTSTGLRASNAAGGAPAAAAAPSASEPVHQPVAQVEATPRQESELDLIDAALARLRAGSASAALSLLEQHAIRYPRGRFRTEREGLRVLALCDSGRLADGRDAQARFLREAGAAPIAARVRAACAEKGAR